ncbi:MAG: protein kinase [Bacteroides sp.]|nr:protein kinase [Bacteroides sp.]
MRKIGDYTVEDTPIGQGGMGQVLRGIGPDGRKVAVKEILPQFVSDPEYRHRIEREILFLMQFDHPSVVKIYDHFELDGRLYIVMELVEGQNLEEYVAQRGPIPWKEALSLMVKLLDAMDHVHSKGIIHRDIKPGNIMIRPDGEVCILDFGVAKSETSSLGDGHHTVLGSIIGTDGYMSPEQAAGMTINYRADIYALGCVLFFMITSRHAYPKLDSEFETMYAILNKPFPRVADLKSGIPAHVQAAIDKAVDRDMTARYNSCGEFRDRLLTNLRGGTEIGTNQRARNISLKIGRAGCDIQMDPENFRISREHAIITRKEFTGGIYYVYTDTSSNGTLIDGNVYTKGMSYNIRRGEYPEILLAGDPAARLDVKAVTDQLEQIAQISAEASGRAADLKGRNSALGYRPGKEGKYSDADSLGQAFKNVFNNYATFTGRAGRGEYWWWVLFNVFVGIIISLVYVAADFNYNVLFAQSLWTLVTIIPNWAVGIRRMHDIGKSGWVFSLLVIFSGLIIPAVILIVFLAQKGEPMNNKYGPGSMPGQMRRV